MDDERSYVLGLIERIVRECPDRRPASASERRAQELVQAELAGLGLATSYQQFDFHPSMYVNLALHFGLASMGTLVGGVAPGLALALHGVSTGSYAAESIGRRFLLRRALPWKRSQNLLAVLPAQGEPELRIVLLAHADAALSGWVFAPALTRRLIGELPDGLSFIRRPIAMAVRAQAVLGAIDALRLTFGPLTWPLRPLEYLLSVPSFLIFLANLQIVLQDEAVPGANDDLSGVAALPVLARRLARDRPPGLELVFAVTGCEEAGFGGATALAREMEQVWDKRRTVVIALDALGGGRLHYIEEEGDIWRLPVPGWLAGAARAVAARDARFGQLQGITVPLGGTDVNPFLIGGWEGLGLVCLDPELGTPTHYHLPEDSPERLDMTQLLASIDFTEALVREVAALRLGPGGG